MITLRAYAPGGVPAAEDCVAFLWNGGLGRQGLLVDLG